MIANITQSKRFQWYMVLAALTCVSAAPSTMEPKTIVAGSSAPEHPKGVVDQSDARVKKNLRTNLDTTESIGENEDRVLIPESIMVPESSAASAIDQEAAAKLVESVETELPDAAVTTGVPAEGHVPAENVGESVEAAVNPEVFVKDDVPTAKAEQLTEAGVIPGASVINHVPAVEVGKSVEAGLQKVAAARTRGSWNIQETIVRRFKKVMGDQKFDENTGDLFKSGQYTEWSIFVDEGYKKIPGAPTGAAEGAKVSTLLTMYGKDAVISMLAAGRKDPITRKIAIPLEIGLLSKWMPNNDRVGDIIHLLTFGKEKSEVLVSDPLKVWFTVLKKNRRNPYKLFVTHFTTRYSDKELAELLIVAKHSDDLQAQNFAGKLAKVQLENWKNSGISVIRSYELLELNEGDLATLLRRPVLSTWIDYVRMLGPDPYEVLLLAMRQHVGDKKLDTILAAAKADGTDESIWRILLHMQEKHNILEGLKREYPQVEAWQREEKTPDDVFDLLQLQEKGEKMFGTKEWKELVAYLTFVEKEKHVEDQTEIAAVTFSVLEKRFPDGDLAKLIAKAKNVEATKDLAAEWERSVWYKADKTSEQVFDLLKLKEKGDMVFESPEFKSWASYVIHLNSIRSVRSREDDVELAYQLYKHYGPDVVRMLKHSEEIAITKNDKVTKEIVTPMLHFFERMMSTREEGAR